MHKTLNTTLLLLSAGFTLLSTGILAQTESHTTQVKSDLSNAVQTIKKVYFASGGIRNSNPEKNILVTFENGQILIHGKVIIIPSQKNPNILDKEAQDALIAGGEKNKIQQSTGAIILGGKNNLILTLQNGIIIQWENNVLTNNSNESIIIWWSVNRIEGNNSFIAGGEKNRIEGNNSLIAGGSKKTIKGNNLFVAGKYSLSQNKNNNVFLRSDNLLRKKNSQLSPQKDNTFLIRSQNGVGIGVTSPQNRGIEVNGFVRIGDEEVTCSKNTKGVIRYTEECFCSCNGKERSTLGISDSCSTHCSTLK